MKEIAEYERPNTVAGLMAKRDQLAALRDQYKAEIKKLTVDIDHLEAAIRLFDPETDNFKGKKYKAKFRAQRGTLKRFVLDQFREATEPLSSLQIASGWAEARGLECDAQTHIILRKRIGACIKVCHTQGLIEDCGWAKDQDGKRPYKMWRLVNDQCD